jgi:trehalose 6-phosphate synthase
MACELSEGQQSEDGAGSAGLVVVSNRLPVRLEEGDDGPRWRISPGGLVSALTPVLRGRDGVWVGWTGQSDSVRHPATHEGIALHAIRLRRGVRRFRLQNRTRGRSPRRDPQPELERRWWQAYVRVNHRCGSGRRGRRAGATVWVHDYHLHSCR